MARDLIIIILFIVAFILGIYFIIRIYASQKIAHLYEILYNYQLQHAYHLCSDATYITKYLDVVFFRHSFYNFLSPYLRDTKLSYAHFYMFRIFPNISNEIDKDYSLGFFL